MEAADHTCGTCGSACHCNHGYIVCHTCDRSWLPGHEHDALRKPPPDILKLLADISERCTKSLANFYLPASMRKAHVGWQNDMEDVRRLVESLKAAILAEKARRSAERGDWP